MNGDKVADIVKGGQDLNGATIQTVFYKVSEIYAVYSTEERVLVQFADDPKLGSEQRLALSPLNPIRGEINGLIDGWRAGGRVNGEKKKSMARRFDRGTADALSVALQGDQQHALELLQSVKTDILNERTSIGRTEYLITASLTAIVIFVLFDWLSTPATLPFTDQLFGNFVAHNKIWLATGAGALGALFSISLDIRSRVIKTDLQRRDNIVDAILRILIGAVSAIILFSLFKTRLVALSLGGMPVDLDPEGDAQLMETTTHMAIVIAFLAGFSERLVGDFLSSAVLSGFGAKDTTSAAAMSAQSAQSKADSNEKNPRGNPAPDQPAAAGGGGKGGDGDDGADAGHSHDDGDSCPCGMDITPDETTDDTELPEASGGIAKAA